MDRSVILGFEISICDYVELIKPSTVEELEKLADTLHQHMETVFIDYADDNDWSDEYSPSY